MRDKVLFEFCKYKIYCLFFAELIQDSLFVFGELYQKWKKFVFFASNMLIR